MDLTVKIYTLIENLSMHHRFSGFIECKKKSLTKNYPREEAVGPLLDEQSRILAEFKKQKDNSEIKEEVKIYLFIFSICKSVEVVNSEGILVPVYFPMLPKTHFLPVETFRHFRERCRIDQQSAKIVDLMRIVDEFDVEMVHNSEMSNKHPTLYNLLSHDSMILYQKIILALAGVLNAVVLLAFERVNGVL
jgi:hypothetical protein